jgi:dGTPase
MIGAMIDDVMGETLRRAKATKVASPDDVRGLDHALVAFSPDMLEDLGPLRAFLMERMYRHWKVNRTRSQAKRILAEMFQLFMAEPEVLPTNGSCCRRTATTPAAPGWCATTSPA